MYESYPRFFIDFTYFFVHKNTEATLTRIANDSFKA